MKKLRLSRTTIDNARVVLRVLTVSWQNRRPAVIGYFAGALVETASFVISIYATAQLGSLLARYIGGGPTDSIWLWLWVDIAAAAGIGIGFWLMGMCKRLLYFRMAQWSTQQFHAALCRIDIADFYDEETRDQVNKAQSGYIWQMANFNETALELMYALLRFTVTALIVTQNSFPGMRIRFDKLIDITEACCLQQSLFVTMMLGPGDLDILLDGEGVVVEVLEEGCQTVIPAFDSNILQIMTIDKDAARRRPIETKQQLDQSTFPASVFTDYGHVLARLDRKMQVLKDWCGATGIGKTDMFEYDLRRFLGR